MPDLDFVPAQRAATTPFTPHGGTTDAPRTVVLTRLDTGGPDEAARAEGWAAGYAAGARRAAEDAAERQRREQAAQEVTAAARAAEHAAALEALRAATRAVHARETPVVADALGTVHAAALELAVALLGVELSDASAAARAALARVLTVPDLPEQLVVHLHPRDLALLSAAGGAPDGVTLAADAALAPGDAVAEHPDGTLDARLDVAVARARAALAAS